MWYKDKIFSSLDNQAIKKIDMWKAENQKIVFTNGCFDLLHSGHIKYLAEAADLGDIFVVGLNSDNSVRRLKGNERPIKSEECRADILAFMKAIDMVVVFDEDTPINLIEKIVPDVLVKGGDWTIDQIVGADTVLKNGGEVKSLTFLEGYSTTKILDKIEGKN